MSRLKDRRVLITGAAGGMGLEMARLFAAEGARLALVDVDAARLSAAADEIGGLTSVSSFVCDLSERPFIQALHKKVHADGGPIQILVNNAGVIATGSYDSLDEAVEERMLRVNALASHWMIRAFLPDLMDSDEGHVVQMASASALLGIPYHVFYGATKSFVAGLAEALRQELYVEGHPHIHVTIVAPGVVNTGFYEAPRAPFLTPTLDPTRVARRVVAAVRKNRPYVREPFMVKSAPLLRALLPTGVTDFAGRLFGTHRIVNP